MTELIDTFNVRVNAPNNLYGSQNQSLRQCFPREYTKILQSLTYPHIRRKQRSAATPNLTDALTNADAVERVTVFQGLHKSTECGTQNRRRRINQNRRRNGYEKDNDKRYTRR